MQDKATAMVADRIKRIGIPTAVLSKKTGIPDGILRRCINSRERDLRADEFLMVCAAIEANPLDFSSK